jgi:hypothetical protein
VNCRTLQFSLDNPPADGITFLQVMQLIQVSFSYRIAQKIILKINKNWKFSYLKEPGQHEHVAPDQEEGHLRYTSLEYVKTIRSGKNMQCVVENRIFTGTGVLVGQTLGIIL